jgi:sarcosine oxidase delta subunit
MSLERCPFCGEIPTTEVRVTGFGGDEAYIDFIIICPVCQTYKSCRLKLKNAGTFLDVEQAMSQAINAWNTRVESKKEAREPDE